MHLHENNNFYMRLPHMLSWLLISKLLHANVASDYSVGLVTVMNNKIRQSKIFMQPRAYMSPAFSGSSVIQCFQHSDALNIHDGIVFNFRLVLLHTYDRYTCHA